MVAGKPIKFQIWDTAGQEKYHSLARECLLISYFCRRLTVGEIDIAMYYRGAAAAIVVYDITRADSFVTLKNWVEELRTQGPADIAIAIAGNKADLDDKRVSDRGLSILWFFYDTWTRISRKLKLLPMLKKLVRFSWRPVRKTT